jgi:hypothetical protein
LPSSPRRASSARPWRSAIAIPGAAPEARERRGLTLQREHPDDVNADIAADRPSYSFR